MSIRMRKRVVKVVVPVVAVALAGVPAVGHASVEDCAGRPPYVETLRVRIKAVESSYRIGDTAVVEAKVDRAVAGHSVPVDGADVSVGLRVADTFVPGAGVTDEHGVAEVKVRLRKHLETGIASGMALARVDYADTPCEPLGEDAWTAVGNFIKVRPFKKARV